jgi:Putative glucoamylase
LIVLLRLVPPLCLDRQHVLLDVQIDRVRINTRQIDVDKEPVATPVRIHRKAEGPAFAGAAQHLLGETIKLAERIKTHHRHGAIASSVAVNRHHLYPHDDGSSPRQFLQDPAPQQAYANIQALRSHYPDVYGIDGFFDALNPVTGAVGYRYLVLDQSMIMAALDNPLTNRAIQRYFAPDPVAWAARTYLGPENMSLG